MSELAFSDTSGEPDDQTEAHAARLELFATTLRRELEGAGRRHPGPGPDPCGGLRSLLRACFR